MFKRPYTGVLVSNGSYEVVAIDASPERDQAREEVLEEYPEAELIALIPGEHARHSWCFNETPRPNTTQRFIDPYDTPMPDPEPAD